MPSTTPPRAPGLRVAVIGAGVIGLSCALELARAGHRVSVHTDRPPTETVSAVAGAVWFPYRVAPRAEAMRWGSTSLLRLTALTADPATGVDLRDGVVVHRDAEPDLWWAEGLAGVRPARPDELPVGAPAATRASFPVADMATYLGWLAEQVERAGVETVHADVPDLAGAVPEAEVLVVAAGLRSGALTGDADLRPVRGQVVRLANPGLETWLIDDANPAGLTYVLPRRHDVVCGGTEDEDVWDTETDEAVEAAILQRCRALVPALADAPVLSRAVGLRPAAPAVSLERREIAGRAVVTCYGHGGAGVTLSWGCAEDVCRLVGEAT